MRYIDLFAGTGGFSEGFKSAGLRREAEVDQIGESAAEVVLPESVFHKIKAPGAKPSIKINKRILLK